ncbi:MAG: NTP transferase domain-containing protein [Steroidobacteraceae bacterium]|nr:NTP transferase domain-containing protein [Steroidobacteraceae bacterium]MCC7199731.1 NTP transferase domain-containing protein [Gammaproteobacteria bacterium]
MTPVYGLVLAGGKSSRMGTDKAALIYNGHAQLKLAYEMTAGVTDRTFVSVRADQRDEPLRAALPQIVDGEATAGPVAGILAAQAAFPDVAWLVVACDLPLLAPQALEMLLARRDPDALATAFTGDVDGLPEPLCAIYEPASAGPLAEFVKGGRACPRKFLINHRVTLLGPAPGQALANVNTPAEHAALLAAAAAAKAGGHA